MANPRKFSEKIALHNQKQAEETRAFEEIMKEMSSIGKAPQFAPQYHSGSLPNVNFPFAGNHIDLQNALSNLHDLKEGKTAYGLLGGGGRIGPMRDRRVHVDRPTPTTFKRFGYVDTSPYPAYLQTLQPPQNNDQAPWRRAASDSALHRSVMQPEVQKTKDGNFNNHQSFEQKRPHSPQVRPKSCEVPGLNSSSCSYDRLKSPTGMFPTSDQTVGLSTGMPGGNTGSLPDLTNLHMNPSPLQTPIDAEDTPYNQTSQQFPLSPTRSQHMKRHNYSGPPLNKFQRQQVQFDPNFSPLESRVQFQYYQQQDPSANLDKPINAPCSAASPTMSPTVSSVSPEFNSYPTTPLSSFSEAYLKQQQNTAAAALQQQLEQFSMHSLNTPISSAAQLPIQSLFSQGQGLYGPNTIMGQYASGNLPNVIVTGTEDEGDRGGDFAKDIGSAIGGVESDLYSPDLKFDPLDIDSLRMLSGTEPVTDPATEETLRLDRLGFSMK